MKRLDRILRPRTVAHAHSGTNSYVFVFIRGAQVWGTVQMLSHDLAHALDGFDAHDPDFDRAVAYVREHFEIGPVRGEPWPLRFDRYSTLEDNGTYLIMHYRVDADPLSVPDEVRIRFDGIVHADHHHEIVATLHQEIGFGNLTIRTTDRYGIVHGAVEVTAPVRHHTGVDHAVATSKAILSRGIRAGRRILKNTS